MYAEIIKLYTLNIYSLLNVSYTLINFLKGRMSINGSDYLLEGYYIWRLHNKELCPKQSCKSVWQALHCWSLDVGSHAASTGVVLLEILLLELLSLLPPKTSCSCPFFSLGWILLFHSSNFCFKSGARTIS